MPKKNWTPEEKKAFGVKMKAAREASKTANEIQESPPTTDKEDVSALLKRIEELEKKQFFPNQGAQLTDQGIVGRKVKYSIDAKEYPDPRDRLFEEKRLVMKNFTHDWFDLDWEVGYVDYDHDGVSFREPRFRLDLIKVVENEETGEPTNERFTVCTGMFFEDPQAFMAVAAQKGHTVPENLQKDFMDEMRYLTIRDWLLEAFYPPRSTQGKSNKRETVIGNRLVEVWEINSENSETIPFGQLKGKL